MLGGGVLGEEDCGANLAPFGGDSVASCTRDLGDEAVGAQESEAVTHAA